MEEHDSKYGGGDKCRYSLVLCWGMEEQGCNYGGVGGKVGRIRSHVGKRRSKAPTMVGMASVGIYKEQRVSFYNPNIFEYF